MDSGLIIIVPDGTAVQVPIEIEAQGGAAIDAHAAEAFAQHHLPWPPVAAPAAPASPDPAAANPEVSHG